MQTSRNKKIDPVLKLYCNIPIMINSNKDIKQGRGNGTLARVKRVCVKDIQSIRKKDGMEN